MPGPHLPCATYKIIGSCQGGFQFGGRHTLGGRQLAQCARRTTPQGGIGTDEQLDQLADMRLALACAQPLVLGRGGSAGRLVDMAPLVGVYQRSP